jgi:hypothetical protein
MLGEMMRAGRWLLLDVDHDMQLICVVVVTDSDNAQTNNADDPVSTIQSLFIWKFCYAEALLVLAVVIFQLELSLNFILDSESTFILRVLTAQPFRTYNEWYLVILSRLRLGPPCTNSTSI